MAAILGKKLGMTQIFTANGDRVPVTVIQAGPCMITQIKTADRDGYTALQFGYGDIKERKVNKPRAGQFQKAGVKPMRHLAEIRVDLEQAAGWVKPPESAQKKKSKTAKKAKAKQKEAEELKTEAAADAGEEAPAAPSDEAAEAVAVEAVAADAEPEAVEAEEPEATVAPGDVKAGCRITVEAFAEGEAVKVSGVSKGKGFAGVMKRHNFKGGPASHGSHFHRAPGSVGASAWPSRVFKGMKLPGQMGNKKSTQRGLTVVGMDAEQNLLFIKGSVPGSSNGIVFIQTD
ncbi:MAG: 50S ribosomal protein L3 [Thermoleophilia bacterium]